METSYTSWGQPVHHSDVRALRRYVKMLQTLQAAGELAALVFAATAVAVFLWFFYSGNFENVIFSDGTSLSCVMDGATGVIKNVE